MAVLRIVRGPDLGREFLLNPEGEILGRKDDCSIVLNHRSVSRSHARILYADNQYVIEDLESHNGTIVNGESCDRHALRENDRIKICGYEFLFSEQPSMSIAEDETID